jgi:hypothetical protein
VRVLRPSSLDEMIAVFLSGELDSSRFGAVLREAFARAGASTELVERPDLSDPVANALRGRLLNETRGGLFGGFPPDVRWEWVAVTRNELAEVRYIDYDYWVELSGGTRLPRDAVPPIRAGVEVFGVSSDGFLEAADALARGDYPVPPLIVVTAGASRPVVVLEGHVRLTAFMLRPEATPPELEVLCGTSATMPEWPLY